MLEGPTKGEFARKWRDDVITVGEAPWQNLCLCWRNTGPARAANLFAYLQDMSNPFLSIVISFLPFYLKN